MSVKGHCPATGQVSAENECIPTIIYTVSTVNTQNALKLYLFYNEQKKKGF